MSELEQVGNHHRKVVAGLERKIEKMKETQRVLAETRQGALMRGEQQNALILRLESRTRALENELVSTHEQIAAMEAERDRYREALEKVLDEATVYDLEIIGIARKALQPESEE